MPPSPDPAPWLEHRVAPEESGQTVGEILRGVMGVSGRRLQRLTRTRGIRLNGSPTHTARRVRAGDRVEARAVDTPPSGRGIPPLPDAAALPPLLLRDPWVLVVDKPAGMPAHPGGRRGATSLVEVLAAGLAAQGEPTGVHLVHRLDRDTSGAVLAARTPGIHHRLDRDLREGRVERRYLAVVAGSPQEDEGRIDAPIGPHPRHRDLRVVDPEGQAAATRWRVVERFRSAALLEAELETGRTHQLRVHLAHGGHPILGDRRYGGPLDPSAGRPALHAHRLRFPHPEDGRPVAVEAPLPAELAALLDRLRLSPHPA